MAGDVNLFWNDLEETTTAEIEVSCRTLQTVMSVATRIQLAAQGTSSCSSSGAACIAKALQCAQVMIAERASRRRGLAREALRMLMGYGASDLVLLLSIKHALTRRDLQFLDVSRICER